MIRYRPCDQRFPPPLFASIHDPCVQNILVLQLSYQNLDSWFLNVTISVDWKTHSSTRTAVCVLTWPLSLYQKGPNRTPVAAICVTSLLTLAFIFIGQVNVLAPIVSINFMLTYSFIDYSYFSVAMTFQLQRKETRPSLLAGKGCHRRSSRPGSRPLIEVTLPNYGSGSKTLHLKGTLLEFTKDMDQMFPSQPNDRPSEKHLYRRSRRADVGKKQKLMDSFGLDLNSNVSPEEEADEASADAPLQEETPAEGAQIGSPQTHPEQEDWAGKAQALHR